MGILDVLGNWYFRVAGFILVQLVGGLLGFYRIVFTDDVKVFISGLCILAIGIFLLILTAARRVRQIGGLRFLFGSVMVFIFSVAFWICSYFLIGETHYPRLYEGLFIVCVLFPALSFWFTGWFAFLRLGPFKPRSMVSE